MIFNMTGGSGGMTLLWQGEDVEDSTVNTAFPEQTIPCDVSRYRAFLLVMRSQKELTSGWNYFTCMVGNLAEESMTACGCTASLGFHRRNLKITTEGIWFSGNGYKDILVSSSSGDLQIVSVNGEFAVPYQIYGLR